MQLNRKHRQKQKPKKNKKQKSKYGVQTDKSRKYYRQNRRRAVLELEILKTIIALSVAGLLLLYINNFWIVTLGLAIFTFNFFVVHVICNRIVSDYNLQKRSVTISIYLLFYYMGSSVWGSATGVVLDHFGWQWFIAGLILLTFILYAIAYKGSKLMENEQK